MQTSVELWNHATREQLQTIRGGKAAQVRVWKEEHDEALRMMESARQRANHTGATLKMLIAEVEVIDALLAKCSEVEEKSV